MPNISISRRSTLTFHVIKILLCHFLRVPDIHAAQNQCIFFYISIDSRCIKIWMILFWPRIYRWEKWSQYGKMQFSGWAGTENATSEKSDIFNFSSATRWHNWALNPLFQSMDPWSKSIMQIFDMLCINIFHYNLSPCISHSEKEILF